MVFGAINDSPYVKVILNVRTSKLTLEPSVNFMAPKNVCWITHAFNKGTLDKTFIIRQTVDAIMILQNLVPPMTPQRKTA